MFSGKLAFSVFAVSLLLSGAGVAQSFGPDAGVDLGGAEVSSVVGEALSGSGTVGRDFDRDEAPRDGHSETTDPDRLRERGLDPDLRRIEDVAAPVPAHESPDGRESSGARLPQDEAVEACGNMGGARLVVRAFGYRCETADGGLIARLR